jgi:hypothetical protein
MEAQGNGSELEDAVGPAAPAVAPHAGLTTVNLAEPVPTALACQTIVSLVIPGMVPVAMAPVGAPGMAPPGGQVIANLAGAPIPLGGTFDIAGALGCSDPPVKSDMRYEIWHKL